jgi:hypothetical protein
MARPNELIIRNTMLTLPIGPGGQEFALGSADLSRDEWAWRFLRLNPSYRRDYRLWREREEALQIDGQALRPNQPIARLLRDPSEKAAQALLQLDSRYFTLSGEILGPKHSKHKLESTTLGAYLDAQREADLGQEHLRGVLVRDFDAPREYGVGAWLPPDAGLPDAPLDAARQDGVVQPSWFFHLNEPVWSCRSAHVLPTRPHAYPLPDGQKAMLGAHRFTVVRAERIAFSAGHRLRGIEFKICLDGYIKQQLAAIERVCAELHNYVGGERKDAPASDAPPFSIAPTQFDCAPARQRRNWYGITMANWRVVPDTFKDLRHQLESEQKALGDKLTFPLRQRGRGHSDPDHSILKRGLCLIEMQSLSSSGGTTDALSQARLNDAVFCTDHPDFYAFRNLEIPPEVANQRGARATAGRLDQVREGLEFGHRMTNGWYEFLVG